MDIFEPILKEYYDAYFAPALDEAFEKYYEGTRSIPTESYDFGSCYIFDESDYNAVRQELDSPDTKGYNYLRYGSYGNTPYVAAINLGRVNRCNEFEVISKVHEDIDGIIEEAVIDGYKCQVIESVMGEGTRREYYYTTDDYCISIRDEMYDSDGNII
jgi:hypothetical protein